LNPFVHFPWVKEIKDISNQTMQVKVNVQEGEEEEMEEIMVRYVHFGDLDRYSLVKVYLEIAVFNYNWNCTIANQNFCQEKSKESLVLN